MTDPRIERLCAAWGVAASFVGADGRRHAAPDDSRRAVLAALGVDVSSDHAVDTSLADAIRQNDRLLPPLLVAQAGRPERVPLVGSRAADEVRWRLEREDGAIVEGCATGAIDLPATPMGYHRLHVEAAGAQADATLLAAPAACYSPDALAQGRRWGVTAQAYSLRGRRDEGFGTYVDVGVLAHGLGAQGAAFLGLSPIHALFAADATKYSPYSPSSRLFLQTGLIAAHAVPRAELLHAGLAAGEGGPLIDYARALPAKRAALEALWASRADSDDAFEAFRRAGGEALERHATFEALSEHFFAQRLHWVGEWPLPFRDASSAQVAAFRRENPERVTFHVWLQWLADAQLAAAAEAARRGGMEIGLYRDLAVGADRGGSEVWSDPDRFVATLSVGAPPDPLGPQGQDWGLPPFHPRALETSGLRAFRDLLAANMRHAGAIRIDHAFQLQRLFVMPLGGSPRDGVYLDYPFDAMLAALRIESWRAKALVIAEDLGTAPDGFSDAIMASGLLSWRVLPFERSRDGAFNPPAAWPRRAMAALSTHDLPTFAGWWRGLDMDLRECFGVFGAARTQAERRGRAFDRDAMGEAFAADGIVVADSGEPPLREALRYLARTPSALVAVQLEDLLGEAQQANMPGPDVGHPNWRRRSSAAVESVAAGHSLRALAAVFAQEGRGARPANAPTATYRLQLHKGFTFDDAAAVAPYLARLGVSHVYLSPIQTARPGSTHGYDVVDPLRLNPELGGEDGFARLCAALDAQGLRTLVDIVPNHMGVGGAHNAWWLDVLEWGRASLHATTFDIDWERPGADGKLIVPFLGKPFEDALADGEIALRFDADQGAFAVWYADHPHPVSPLDYGPLLAQVGDAGLAPIAGAFDALAKAMDPIASARAAKRRLARTCADDPAIGERIEASASRLAPEALRALCDRQTWRLVCWTEANAAINYRRFFDITSLAGLRMEDKAVFERWHALIFRLVREGRIHGLRIDHVDGLADPAGYLRRLDEALGPDFFVVVEKILEPGERLPDWPIAGTTGYDALRVIDGLFLDPQAAAPLSDIVAPFADKKSLDLAAIKSRLATETFASETGALAADLRALAGVTGRRTGEQFDAALHALLAAFPVYRTYVEKTASAADHETLAAATQAAGGALRPSQRAHLRALATLLGEPSGEMRGRAIRRFQQLTGPLMAKSFEDTLFYRDARFIAANEVGWGPHDPAVGVAAFHRANAERAARWPDSLVASATHDTKRGEDARGRLLAASWRMEDWRAAWDAFGVALASCARDLDRSDLYFLFQSLIAACPIAPDADERHAFEERAKAFVLKALRESKRRSTWTTPDERYEAIAQDCVAAACAADGPLFGPLAGFIATIAEDGGRIGLARTALKCTIPGVPDIYQGTERADLSFVDPDNRRPVDFSARRHAIDAAAPLDAAGLRSGALKLRVLERLLHERRAHPATWRGAYRPLETRNDAAVAFLRDDRVLVLARRAFGAAPPPIGPIDIPDGRWRNLLAATTLGPGLMDGDAILDGWPAAILTRIDDGSRPDAA